MSWDDEEDKANAKYDSNSGKGKNNIGGKNNKDQGGRNNNNNNNYYSGANRKCKPDNTVAVVQCPTKDTNKKTSGGFKDLLIEKCSWHQDSNHTTEKWYELRRHSRRLLSHDTFKTRRAKPKSMKAMAISKNPTRWSTSSSVASPPNERRS
jgi:hypothetical protein